MQALLLLCSTARGAALCVKDQQHLVQPGAVLALFEFAVELVVLAQPEHVAREEAVWAIAQRLGRAGGNLWLQQRGRDRGGPPHRSGCELDACARVGPRHEAVALLREFEGQARDQRAVRERVAVVDAAAQEGQPRCAQQLRERE